MTEENCYCACCCSDSENQAKRACDCSPKTGFRITHTDAFEITQQLDVNEEYSVDDDAYSGKRRNVDVQFYALDLVCCDRCMGSDERTEKAVEICRSVLDVCGYDISLSINIIDDEKKAEAARFYSSPTIRVNGVDICPSIEENDCVCCGTISDRPIVCRLFPYNGQYYEVPPTAMIVEAILEIVFSGQAYDPTTDPYELPKNFADFFAGVEEKSAKARSCCC